MSRVCVTGAAGSIGRVVADGLLASGAQVVAIDRRPAPDVSWQVHQVDVADPVALAPLVDGCDAIVHLASDPSERPLGEALESHVGTAHAVLEAMRTTGVPRVVYASSNHAVGHTPRPPAGHVGADLPPRPDTNYGVAKVAAEALLRLYVDRYGCSAVSVRIGSFGHRPTTRRHLATWLSPGDAVRVAAAAATAPVTYACCWGISANTRRWWDLRHGHDLGFHPVDDAEDWAAEILGAPPGSDDDLGEAFVGGEFVGRSYDHDPVVGST